MTTYRLVILICLIAGSAVFCCAVAESRGATASTTQTVVQKDDQVKKTAHQRRIEARKRLADAIAARKAQDPNWHPQVTIRNAKEATK